MAFYNFTVDAWPASWAGLQFDCSVTSSSELDSSFAIVNNTVGNNRGRGIELKAGYGTVSRNTILGPKFWGIEVSIMTVLELGPMEAYA